MSLKLSEKLATLADKTRSIEDRIALVNTENKEKLDAKIAEARADVEAKKNAFKAKTEAIKSDADSSVAAVKNSFKEKLALFEAHAKAKKTEIETKISNEEHKLDVHFAESGYRKAVDYADNCIDWAMLAIAEVEEATLEVISAKEHLDNLKKNQA